MYFRYQDVKPLLAFCRIVREVYLDYAPKIDIIIRSCESVKALVAQSCLTLYDPNGPTRLLCPWDSSSKNSGVACHSLLQGIFLTQGACLPAKSLQSHPTLCDPMDCSSPGFSVHGILQARILEWVPMPSSRGSS